MVTGVRSRGLLGLCMLLKLLQTHAAVCPTPEVGPCWNFHTNVSLQIDFEAPRYGATVGERARG
jgi:hypothetical protein